MKNLMVLSLFAISLLAVIPQASAAVNSVQPGSSCGTTKEGHQVSRIRYKEDKVKFEQTCESEVQKITCKNGRFSNWSGSFKHISCNFAANVKAKSTDEKAILDSYRKGKPSSGGNEYIANDGDGIGEGEDLEKAVFSEDGDPDIVSSSTAASDVDTDLENAGKNSNSGHPLDTDYQYENKDNDDTLDNSDLEDI